MIGSDYKEFKYLCKRIDKNTLLVKQNMALYLSAEQKNLKSLFSNDNRYIIPNYQRHYSWTMEQCRQLYDDIMDAYSSGTDSYFLGNIVLAEDEHDDRPEVVDGQQRLITLWLFLKAIHILHPFNNRLKRMIQVESYEDDSTTDFVSTIFSDVFEVKDQEQIDAILTKTKEDFEKDYLEYLKRGEMLYYKNSTEQVKNNAIAIYALMREYFSRLDDEKQKVFVDFFISKIYLLPIVLKDDDLDEARSNALLVFETINNRGMDLQDADIFKAKLYYMSLSVGKGEKFKEEWKNLISRCDDLELKIDDLFRYYYHIIRGKEGIVIAEKRLREFFQKDPKSPFKTGGYEIVLEDLQKTLDAIEVYYYKRTEPTRLGAWLQVLDAYTNQNPVYALIVFLYFHKEANEDDLIEFLKKVLRYCYYRGSTMSVKFEIYNIIYRVAANLPVDDYLTKNIDSWMWNYPGRLRKGLSLLAFYLKYPNQVAVKNYKVDKILKSIDSCHIDSNWPKENLDDDLNSLGNNIVLDMPQRNTPIYQRYQSYKMSELEEVKNLISTTAGYTYRQFTKRIKDISKLLENFFVNGKEGL